MGKAFVYAIISSLITLLVVGVAAIISFYSTWFYFDLLPNQRDFALGLRPTQTVTSLMTLSELNNDPIAPIIDIISLASRVAYSKTSDFESVIMLPKILRQGEARRKLSLEGWQYKTFGPLLFAQRGLAETDVPGSLPARVMRALINPWQQYLAASLPLNPPILISAPHVPLSEDIRGFTVISQASKSGIHISMKAVDTQKKADDSVYATLRAGQHEDSNTFQKYQFAALPSKLLKVIPKDIKNAVFEKSIRDLGFTFTSSRIMKDIVKLEILLAYQGEGATALGTHKEPDSFIKQAKAWVVAEESYHYPQKRAFQLPDGTLGYEIRPSKPASKWVNVENNCQYLKGKEKTWWLCQSATAAVISNKVEIARAAMMRLDQSSWQLHLASLTDDEIINGITSVDVKADKSIIDIYINK